MSFFHETRAQFNLHSRENKLIDKSYDQTPKTYMHDHNQPKKRNLRLNELGPLNFVKASSSCNLTSLFSLNYSLKFIRV